MWTAPSARRSTAAISVNGLDHVDPSPHCACAIIAAFLLRFGIGAETAARRGLSVSSTHSMPNAQPPITSLGQCTPSITRLVPISSDSRIARRPRRARQRLCRRSAPAQAPDRRSSSWPRGRSESCCLDDDQVRLEVRAGRARSNISALRSGRVRPAIDEQQPEAKPAPGHPQAISAITTAGADQHRRLTERGEDTRGRQQQRGRCPA